MGDFQDVFGTGATAENIIDNWPEDDCEYTREKREKFRKARLLKERTEDRIILHSWIENSNFKIRLMDYQDVERFDHLATAFNGSFQSFDAISYTRKKVGAAYLIEIDEIKYQTPFTRKGIIVIHDRYGSSEPSREDYPELREAHFCAVDSYDFEEYGDEVLLDVLERDGTAVCQGNQLLALLKMKTRIKGWSPEREFFDINSRADIEALQANDSW